MPRKKRVKGERETISFRDLQVLDFICRFGVVNRTAVQWWAETGRSVTLDRERRLREAGLISAHPPIGRSGPLLAVTSRGLRLADRTELGPARVSVWSANHSIVCAQLAAHLERSGDEVLSERELLAEERRFGDRCYSAMRSYPERGWHRPDLYRFTLEDERAPGARRRGRADREGAGATGGHPQRLAVPQDAQPRRPRADPAQQADPALDPLPLRAQGRCPSSSEPWRKPGPTGASRSRSSGSITPPLPDLRASLAAG